MFTLVGFLLIVAMTMIILLMITTVDLPTTAVIKVILLTGISC